MKFRAPIAGIVYAGSYLPLSLILLVQDFKYDDLGRPFCVTKAKGAIGCELPVEHPFLAISLFIFCLACFCVTLGALSAVKTKLDIKIHSSKHVAADLMNYVLPYVVAFMNLDYKDQSKFSGFVIFFLWIFWISYKSGQVILNPLLIAFGWRLYEIEYSFPTGGKLTGLCLSKVQLTPDQSYKQTQIEDIFIIK